MNTIQLTSSLLTNFWTTESILVNFIVKKVCLKYVFVYSLLRNVVFTKIGESLKVLNMRSFHTANNYKKKHFASKVPCCKSWIHSPINKVSFKVGLKYMLKKNFKILSLLGLEQVWIALNIKKINLERKQKKNVMKSSS